MGGANRALDTGLPHLLGSTPDTPGGRPLCCEQQVPSEDYYPTPKQALPAAAAVPLAGLFSEWPDYILSPSGYTA